jgi:integrase/recombinase XerD
VIGSARESINEGVLRRKRLAAIKSFMRFVEFRVPAALEQVRQIRAIPVKRHDQNLVPHLAIEQVRAILSTPDPATRFGIRDRAMLHLRFACGLRVSELVGLPLTSVSLQRMPSVRVCGKGRRERCLPLWKETATELRAWLAVRGNLRVPELFVNAAGTAMTRDGFEYILEKHTRGAALSYEGLRHRTVSPHQLRHTCAIIVLRATHDFAKWRCGSATRMSAPRKSISDLTRRKSWRPQKPSCH